MSCEFYKYRFEDSEYALHDQIKKCSFFATESKIYPTLVKLDFIGTLSYLLVHDNIVISTDVIKLLWLLFHSVRCRDDLTDDETILMDASGEAVGLIDAVVFPPHWSSLDCSKHSPDSCEQPLSSPERLFGPRGRLRRNAEHLRSSHRGASRVFSAATTQHQSAGDAVVHKPARGAAAATGEKRRLGHFPPLFRTPLFHGLLQRQGGSDCLETGLSWSHD